MCVVSKKVTRSSERVIHGHEDTRTCFLCQTHVGVSPPAIVTLGIPLLF